jgi:hypothetical protein
MGILDPKPPTRAELSATYLTGAVKDATGTLIPNKRFIAVLDANGEIDDIRIEVAP